MATKRRARRTSSTGSNEKTSSKSAGAARPRKDKTARKPLRPLTTDHFRRWAGLCVLDTGGYWDLEGFQLEIADEVFARYREVLAVLPTGSYKTTTAGGLALYHCQYTEGAKVPIGAASKDQAAICYEQACGFIRRTPGLGKRFKIQDGYRRIKCLATGGLIKVYSAKDDTGDGIIPTLPILDELHRHKGHDLYGTWRDKLIKRDATMLVLSTAGDDENNPVEELRDAAHKLPKVKRRGRKTVARTTDRGFVMIEYALREKDSPQDLEPLKRDPVRLEKYLELVKLANPAEQVTIEELRTRLCSPSTKDWQWRRYTTNLRSKGEESKIDPDDFDRLLEKGLVVPAAVPVYGWLDLGWQIDTTAIGVLAWVRRERRLITDVKVLKPPVDEADIVVALLRLQELYGDRVLEDGAPAFKGIVYDPNAGGRQMAQMLEKGEHPLQTDDERRDAMGLEKLNGRVLDPLVFIEHSQDNAPMVLAASRLDEAIRNRWIRHDGNPDLRKHFLNAVSRSVSGEKWRYDRPADAKGRKRAKYPIDALTGVLMGNNVAEGEHDDPEDEPPTDFLDYQLEFA